MWQLPLLVMLIVGTVLIIRKQQSMPYRQCSNFIFGTTYNITYQCDSDLTNQIQQELQEVDREFSMFNEKSTVARLNRGETTKLSPMFLEVYNLAQQVSEATDGAFDITVAPLVNAWGFGFKNEQMPSRRQVDSLLQLTGYKKLTLRNGRLSRSHPGVMLDFSAIAKGYGSDAVAKVLRRHDVSNFMVEIGGEVVTSGVSSRRLPWRIGVTKPVDDSLATGHELQTVLNVTDMAMATSGNYRNFYYKGGRKYAHTIDPKTGYPVQHNILSATVLAPTCAKADAFATAFMVMGLERAKEVLERYPELMAYFICSDQKGQNTVWYSPSLEKKIAE